MSDALKLLILLFPVVGLLLFPTGMKYRRRLKARVAAFLRTPGTVIGSSEGLAGGFDTAPVYNPVVEYRLGNQRFTITGNVGYGRSKKEGTMVTVMYDPANPSTAFIMEDYYLAANIIIALGGTFMLFGSLLAYELIWASNR